MRRERSPWIKAVATGLLLPLAILMLNPAPAIAAIRAQHAERARIIEQAGKLHIDAQMLLDPKAYDKRMHDQQEAQRKLVVAQHLMNTAPPKENIERLNREVQEVEDAYAIHGVAGLADDVTDLQHAVNDLGRDPSAGTRVVALERSTFRHAVDTLSRFDHAVVTRLQGMPLAIRTRHIAFMAKARTEFGAIEAGLTVATLGAGANADSGKKVSRAPLTRIAPRMASVSSPRSVRAPVGEPAADVLVRSAPVGTELLGPASLDVQKARFVPSGRQIVDRFTGAATSGIARGTRLAPMPLGIIEALLATTLRPIFAPPLGADSSGTIDAPLAPEIVAKATELGNDPVRIFNFVHDQIDTEIYMGSRKGAVGTLAERAGNDADQASLLVALLRAAGFPTRYELVGFRLDPEQWKNLTGVATAEQAASMLATAGYSVEVTSLASESGTNQAAVNVFLVGVRAFVPYANYRGQQANHPGESTWVPLLPVLKQYRTQTAVDLRPGAAFDQSAYLSHLTSDSPLAAWEKQLHAYALANGKECATLAQAQPLRSIVPDALPYLRADYPSPQAIVLGAVSELPASYRNSARLRLMAPTGSSLFDVSLPLVSLYGKRVSLTYAPATATDASVIASFGGLEATPLYLVQLKAELRLDDTVVATSALAQPAGTDNKLNVTLNVGDRTESFLSHVSTAGSVYVWQSDPGFVPLAQLDRAEASLAAAPAGSQEQEMARLYLMGLRYFRAYGEAQAEVTGIYHSRVVADVQEGTFAYEMNVTRVGGVPMVGTRDSVILDVGRILTTPFAVDGTDESRVAQKLLLGLHGSALEHITPGMFHGPNEYSAVRLIQQAHASGVPVYEFEADQVLAFLPLLNVDPAIRDAVEDAAKPGRTLIVPKQGFTPPAFRPLFGFISFDPATGGAQYMFNGSFDGGGGENGEPSPGSGSGCATCDQASEANNSQVILGRGNYTDEQTDLILTSPGMPVVFTRAYHSYFSKGGGGLGPGWIHSYAAHLDSSPSGVSLVTASGEWPFAANGDTSYVEPPGFDARLSSVTTGYILEYRNGIRWKFDQQGRLKSQEDLNGNIVSLQYDSAGHLITVTDASGRIALRFDYDVAARLHSVTDAAGRVVTFGHDAGGYLTSVTGPLAGATRWFGYDESGKIASKTNWNGQLFTIAYDEAGRFARSTDPMGGTYRATYEFEENRVVYYDRRGFPTLSELGSRGERRAVVDPLGNRTSYSYDRRLNVTSIVDSRGGRREMAYDADDNLIREISPLGTVTEHTYALYARRLSTVEDVGGMNVTSTKTYDANFNCSSETDATGQTTFYTYATNGQPDSITQPGGATTSMAYGPTGNVVTVVDAEGASTDFGYDPAGRLVLTRDGLGQERAMTLDARGHVLVMKDPEGNETRFTFDPQGNRLTATDAEGHTTTTVYDPLNRVIQIVDALGGVTRLKYDAEGNKTGLIDQDGNRTSLEYDATGRLVTRTDAAGNVTRWGYCAAEPTDTPCEEIDGLGNLSRKHYNLDGNLIDESDELGFTTSIGYDSLGRETSRTNEENAIQRRSYDALGRTTSVVDAIGGTFSYAYDSRGNLTSMSDANGNFTSYVFDKTNRLTAEINPIGKVWQYAYDATGNRVSMIEPDGKQTTYIYDANRRLTERRYADGTVHRFTYDARGAVLREETPAIDRTYTYDALGRLGSATDHRFSTPIAISYGYDHRGNRTTMALEPGHLVSTYRWDERGLLTEVTDPDGEVTRVDHDALGRRSSLRYPNGVMARFGYDDCSELLSLVWLGPSGNILTASQYEYDARGNVVSKNHEDGDKERYEYDRASRLLAVTHSGESERVEYGYDPAGNRIRKSEVRSGGVSMSTTSEVYVYNAASQLIGRSGGGVVASYEYDENGNQTSRVLDGEAAQFEWDADNRLSTNGMRYDASGLRVEKKQHGVIERYVLDGQSVVATMNEAGNVQAFYMQNPARVDEVFSATDESGTKTYPLTDGQGSVLGLTDGTGRLVSTFRYDVYGSRRQTSGTTVIPYGYTGREHDEETGLTYHRDRYLDPKVGSWTQPDRIASASIGTRMAAGISSGMPSQAWRMTASIASMVTSSSGPRNPYRYTTSPAVESDPSGFEETRCHGEDYLGAPLVYVEGSLGPFALVVFGGIYTSLDSGATIGAVGIYGEAGRFFELDKNAKGLWSIVHPDKDKKAKVHFEIGVGFGYEDGICGVKGFKGPAFSVEGVVQGGPIVVVFSTHGGALMVASSIQIGAALFLGTKYASWAWEIQDGS